MKINTWGFNKVRAFKKIKRYFKNNRKIYYGIGYNGIMLFDRKFLGFTINDNNIVIDYKTFESKRSIVMFIYIFYYTISIDLK